MRERMRNHKQYTIWGHARSGSTYLVKILNMYLYEKYHQTNEYHLVENEEMLSGKFDVLPKHLTREKIIDYWTEYNNKDVYSVWKTMTDYRKLLLDINEIYEKTNCFSVGRRNWKHTVISYLRSLETQVWNTVDDIDIKEANYNNVTFFDVLYITKMIAQWHRVTRLYEIPYVWYEDLSFTSEDLKFFNINDSIELDSQYFTKKITKDSEYELFDEILKKNNINIKSILRQSRLQLDPDNPNLLKNI